MIRLVLPENRVRPLPFFLAMEEWAARCLPPGEWFFTWVVDPTVIIGRHQDLEAEVNVPYCRANGINLVRRKSGGGAVFADRGNIMFSYVTSGRETSVEEAFSHFTSMLVAMLRSLGIPAEASGRNDLLIEGRKVSGCSYYRVAGAGIAHGTMLNTVDTARMAAALTPSREKLSTHAVPSVRSRVTCVADYRDISTARLREYAGEHVAPDIRMLTPDEVAEVERLTLHYYAPGWLEGTTLAQRRHRASGRVEGAGTVEVAVSLKDGCLEEVTFSGDFLCSGSMEPVSLALKGCRADEGEIAECLARSPLSEAAPGIPPSHLASIIYNATIYHATN